MASVAMTTGAERRPVWDDVRGDTRHFAQTFWTYLTFGLCVVVVVSSIILGGGTRSGFLSDAILQLIAIPLLLISLSRLREIALTRQMRVGLFFCAAIAAIPLIQLIPLPPLIWTALPGRETVAATFDILGQDPPWMPISVAPNETWLSALSLIPPMAIFLGTMLSDYRERRWLTQVFLAVGVVSVFLGFIQVAQGSASPWRFFDYTNPLDAVGFFANKNHFAALLYALVLFAAAWMIHAATKLMEQLPENGYDTTSIILVIAAFTLLVVLLAGAAIARSRMGLVLTILALLGAVGLAFSDRRVGIAANATRLVVGAGVLALIFSAQFALYDIMQRFVTDDFLQDARIQFGRNTLEAAIAQMPFGSGLGTFVPVYALFEKPEDALVDTYANHAHNDFLELWLTTGIFGSVLAAMLLAWLTLRSVEIWRGAPARGASELDLTLARAATLVVALLVAHSFVDYPLRTGAIMAVMAFACALLIEPPLGAEPAVISAPTLKPTSEATSAPLPDGEMADSARIVKPAPVKGATLTKEMFLKRLHGGMAERKPAPDNKTKLPDMRTIESPPIPTEPKPKPASETPGASEGGTLAPDQRWGTDIEWPEEWSKSTGLASDKDKPPSGRKS
jgi:O-antigen ligase